MDFFTLAEDQECASVKYAPEPMDILLVHPPDNITCSFGEENLEHDKFSGFDFKTTVSINCASPMLGCHDHIKVLRRPSDVYQQSCLSKVFEYVQEEVDGPIWHGR